MPSKQKKLFILTQFYPTGNSENSFIKAELEELCAHYETVYTLPLFVDNNYLDKLPINVKVEFIFNDYTYARPSISLHLIRAFLLSSSPRLRDIFNYKYYKSLASVWSLFMRTYSRYLQFERFMSKFKAEDVFLYSFWFNDWATIAGFYKLKHGKIPFISRAHGFDLYEERHSLETIPFRNFQLKMINRLFLISNNGKNYILKKHPQFEDKYIVSYLGSVLNHNRPSIKSASLFTIVSCANLFKIKRVHLIVEALSNVGINIKWIHIGDGAEFENIKEAAKKLPFNIQAEFKGQVKNEEVMRFYSENYVDAFISVSETEGLPVSLMEAASFGIPLIATNVGGVSEIVNEKTGVLLDPDFNTSDLSDILNKLPGSKLCTPEFRNGIKSYWQERFDARNNAKKFVRSIENI